MQSNLLELALRAQVISIKRKKKWNKSNLTGEPKWPTSVLTFDTETTTDTAQSLLFGSYRYSRWKGAELECVEEGIFFDNDLPTNDANGFATLTRYVEGHPANVASGFRTKLRLLSKREFLEQVFWPAAYRARCLVVGFNLPFDLSRLAFGCGEARGKYRGGFSLKLFDYLDEKTGKYRDNPNRPRIRIKHINSKLAFIGFGQRRKADPGDRAEDEPPFQGNFLDLRTAFALTNIGYTLEGACEEFKVDHPKMQVLEHGKIRREYMDYNRRDVLTCEELLVKLRLEFDRHSIELTPMNSFSTASVAKAYLRASGLNSPAKRFASIPTRILGYTMTAYFGGRAECRIRKVIVPVVYVDFASMYPTVNTLMRLWKFLIAQRLEIVDATQEVTELLNSVNLNDCFKPDLWPKLQFFGLVQTDGDVLPVRARYSGDAFNIGINPLTCDKPLWFAGPDLVASSVLSGKPPKVLKAFKLVPKGQQGGLKSVNLSGEIPVDPATGDFFKNVVEERKRLASKSDLSPEKKKSLGEFLKVLVNSGSYGIFAELIREELPAKQREAIKVFGLDSPFTMKTNRPEKPGEFCFPPLAALITSAARLMLALLERCVTDAGGAYVFCDTDSLGIVANQDGGPVKCGDSEINALSWQRVESVVSRFETLNPYDKTAVPGSILKIEDVNFKEGADDRRTNERQQLYTFAISAKRYVLFRYAPSGEIIIEKPLEHGLGHLLDPADPVNGNSKNPKKWIASVWELIVREDLGLSVAFPDWFDRPAISKLTITSPQLLKPFIKGRKKRYRDSEKPSNFLLTAHVAKLGHPSGVDPTKFQLALPYTRDARLWTKSKWTDVYSGKSFAITTKLPAQPGMVRVKSIRDVYEEYKSHPEPKSADSSGKSANRRTRGLLRRLRIRAISLVYVGKESNLLEDVENETVHDWDDVQQEYADERLDLLNTLFRQFPTDELARAANISTRAIRAIRNGHSRPTKQTRDLLIIALRRGKRTLTDASHGSMDSQ